jgi:hypothetical protein
VNALAVILSIDGIFLTIVGTDDREEISFDGTLECL